jgi:hypothetical protein
MTHDDLIIIGKRWLQKQRNIEGRHFSGTKHIATEVTSVEKEQADVIGWHDEAQFSTLIECKISRADFFADRKKSFRIHPETGMGQFRYFLVPKDLVKIDELPEGWGLLEVDGKNLYATKRSKYFDYFNIEAERSLLVSMWRRERERKAYFID